MSFEQPPNKEQEIAENREHLKENFGVVLCTKNKEKKVVSLKDQIELADELNLPAVQFDFRNRTSEEISKNKDSLIRYRESHPETFFSIHGNNLEIDVKNISFENKDEIVSELELLQELSGESYTIHPPAIPMEIYSEPTNKVKIDQLLEEYSDVFIKPILEAIKKEKQFSVAIENSPNKGIEGKFGQKVEDILLLIKKIEEKLIERGIEPEVARQYIGATLDINHTLEGEEIRDTQSTENNLEPWFKMLGDYLKVIHLYTPSGSNDESFNTRYLTSLKLASQYNPKARLLMESKQNAKTTREVYKGAKQLE